MAGFLQRASPLPCGATQGSTAMWHAQLNWTLVGALLLNCALWIGFLILYL